MGRRRGHLAVAVVLSGVTVLLGLGAPTSAAYGCLGPVLAVGDTVDEASPDPSGQLSSGGTFVVSGRLFRQGCSDVFVSNGCGPPTPLERETAMQDVDLVLEQGRKTWTLATADAAGQAQKYAITWRGRLPDDVRLGAATLRAGETELPVTITR